MANLTVFQGFHFLTFSKRVEDNLLIFSVFLIIYLLGVLANSVIIAIVALHRHLHTPMYTFLCNLSFVDICYTTVTIPKLLDMLLSGNNTMTFLQCFVQMHFYWMSGGIEDILLFTMAYDRYVAICSPLHYHRIFTKGNLTRLIVVIWASGFLNSVFVTISASYMSFCNSTTVNQFFCDAKALTKISCTIAEVFYIAICLELFLFGLCPFLCSLMSYLKIISVILKIQSKEGRMKAFSTCSSHLCVLLIYFGTGLPVYLKPLSDHADVLDQIFSVFYTTVTPLLNPLIYSLRNKEVKMALMSSLVLRH
ncbi:PREDICTED: olfactory receptor 5V1-like [Nanorana parkeri]|uniref:olfactory receptor 5V1-like n=1 Tax=Nanorana parkeri TaxID=125878 RepID=UPI0008541355|nr:PREDICTED: olfactory receptor 5V1-like [Nanorana parkeri]